MAAPMLLLNYAAEEFQQVHSGFKEERLGIRMLANEILHSDVVVCLIILQNKNLSKSWLNKIIFWRNIAEGLWKSTYVLVICLAEILND